ncbi:AAA family ATPase [Tumebacillus sp. ITR2]|uniref:AAA family ATPase n=1 Tax=Tumebacillus amylolyticus TaxID=2801339 RepID=A0ABS1J6F3_9BACL|nr:AAA family ATPase [Tumebacillus amylolyticus]MBL0385841.1 AAA family ATPase [Tumebacillus amylolyticus]
MQIRAIQIQNFKGYEQKEFAFDPNFTLIIGDNGTGKTTILEAISVGIGGFLAGLEGVETRNINKDEVRLGWDKPGDATVTREKHFPVSISCVGVVADELCEWTRELRSSGGRTTRGEARSIIAQAQQMQERIIKHRDHEVVLPMFSYQGAGRLFSQKRNMWVNPFTADDLSRFLGYTHCLDAESDIKMFVSWLRRMTMIQLQKRKHIGELDAVLGAVTGCMRGLMNEEVNVYFDFEEEEVVVENGEVVIPLRMMSSGYRTIIGMVADLAYRAAILNPQLRERAVLETPGIVLIDELDLHLHPKWQWVIIENLKKTFPNIQFIATTHAPIIISSCKDGFIINLEDGVHDEDSMTQPSSYGWLIEDILKKVMGTQIREPHIQKQIQQLEVLYSKKMEGSLTAEELVEMERLMEHLVEQLPESDPAVTLAELAAIELQMEKGSDETSNENS